MSGKETIPRMFVSTVVLCGTRVGPLTFRTFNGSGKNGSLVPGNSPAPCLPYTRHGQVLQVDIGMLARLPTDFNNEDQSTETPILFSHSIFKSQIIFCGMMKTPQPEASWKLAEAVSIFGAFLLRSATTLLHLGQTRVSHGVPMGTTWLSFI